MFLCCLPRNGFANIITVIIKGTVSEGTDFGIFAAPHTDLSGQRFTLTFTFDDTKGQEADTTCCAQPPVLAKTERSGTGASSPGNAILQIGNVPYSFPTSTRSDVYRSGGPIHSTAYFDVSVQDAINDSEVFALVYPASGVLSQYVNWESSFSSTNLRGVGVYGFHITVWTGNGYLSSGGELTASSITESGLVTVTNIYTLDQKAEFTATASWLTRLAGQLGELSNGCGPLEYLPRPYNIPAILCGLGSGFISAYATMVSGRLAALAADPPDAHFMQIATPVIPPYTASPQDFPDGLAASLDELSSDFAHMYGIQTALVISLNRLRGAQIANNSLWVRLQQSAVRSLNDQLSGYSARTAAAIQSVETALKQSGAMYTTTTADASALKSYISDYGLPADIISGIKQFFGNQTEISNATHTMETLSVTDISAPLAGTGSLFDSVSSWMSSLSQSIGGTCTTINTIRSSFGRTANQPGFVPAADVNKDGIINVIDLAAAARLLPAGTSCP